MPVTLAAPPGDLEPPTPETMPAQSEILRRLTALQARDERLVADRRTALLLAALTARLARAYRRDRERLLRANLALQVELDAAAVRERYAAVQVRAYAREVAELQAARREMAAENAGLRERHEPGQHAGPKPARGRRRR
jgi:hypothetical protein